MRKWFTASELAGLPGLPGTERGVLKLAKREGWEGQRRLGTKAVEYGFAALPKEAQAALLVRLVADQQSTSSQQMSSAQTILVPKRDAISASRLTDDQRDVMSARLLSCAKSSV